MNINKYHSNPNFKTEMIRSKTTSNMHKLSEIGSNRYSVQSPTQEITTNKFSDSQNRVAQVPSNYDMMRKKHSLFKRDLKRKVLMPNKKAQQEIER